MKLLKLSMLCLFVLSFAAADAPGQIGKFAKNKDKGKSMASSATLLTDPLEPADLVAKLKLTGTQKTDADKLFKEFDTKLKEIASKATTEPAGGDKTAKFKGKGKGGAGASPSATAAIELRETYGEKFEALLTDAQKKVVEDYRVKQGEALLSGATPKK